MKLYFCCSMNNKEKSINIAIVGNPNCGKSSLFNALTGLHQKVGNFPGVTVDKKTGILPLSENLKANIIDLPGMYSIYPRREDEWVAYRVLMGCDERIQPDMVLLVIDASNLKRNLLFCTQLIDLNYKVVVAMTMSDIAAKKGIKIDTNALSRELSVPIIPVNPRTNKGVEELKKTIFIATQQKHAEVESDFVESVVLVKDAVETLRKEHPNLSSYRALHYFINAKELPIVSTGQRLVIADTAAQLGFNETKTQAEEVLYRYQKINQIIANCVSQPDPLRKKY